MKKKISWKKILLWIFFFPFMVMYYLFKFYTSKRFTTKQKVYSTLIAVALFTVAGVINESTLGPEIKKVTVEDVAIFKGENKKLNIVLSPKDADIKELSLKDYDKNIISFNKDTKKIKALNEGQTTVICEIEDTHSNIIKSNKFTITVNLTEKQIEEKNRKAAEEAAKQEQELLEKRNTISTSEGIRIRDYCKESVNKILKSPSSAEYPDTFLNPLKDWNMVKSNNLVTVKSYVDSQNSFGAMIRSEFIIQIQMTDDGSGTLSYLKFDGEVVYGSFK